MPGVEIHSEGPLVHAERMKLRLLVAAVAAALLLGACSSDDEPTSDPSASKGEGEKIVAISPLTGKPMPDGRPDNPVFVVKIENTGNGAPQYGLNKADLVVEELVEGGLTRLAALYYSTLPKKVGHVRSLRATDISIAKPVAGQIVASGGAPSTNRRVGRAGVTVFSETGNGDAFSGDPAKSRPYDRLINLRVLAKKAKKAKIPGPYLTWAAVEGSSEPPATPEPDSTDSANPPPEPKKSKRATVRFSNSTSTGWKFAGGHWKRTNGHAASGQDFAADTLVVMFCRVGVAGYRDPAGNPVPETIVKGSGRAVVLRDGTATETTWKKPARNSPISFETKDGQPLPIEPGHVWIELAPKGAGSISY